ncbi:MAG: hypothetical protein OXI74_17170 [Rhodospirillaceae bacterium]|nr:hypothetical protein [Rhodospirillaceae bacterium]
MQPQGPTTAGLMYSDTAASGPVVVLLHGVLMNGSVWKDVVDGLRDRYRCIVPELPFGALPGVEATLARTVNPNLMTCSEWQRKRDEPDSFAARVASQPILFVIGDAKVLAESR